MTDVVEPNTGAPGGRERAAGPPAGPAWEPPALPPPPPRPPSGRHGRHGSGAGEGHAQGDGPAPATTIVRTPDPVASLARLGLVVGLIVVLGVAYSWWVVVFVLALVAVIFLHELGHYMTARWAGMKVTEFFLGFGPRIWSFRKGDVEYGLKAIPAGAYVKIIGMHNLEEVPPEDEDKTYRQKSYWRRLSVAVAGSTMHFIIAIAVLFATLAFFGVPRASHWSIASLSPDSPATRAGLVVGDRILAIDGDKISTFDDMTTEIRSRPGQAVALTVRHRDGSVADISTTLADRNTAGEAVGFLGVGQTEDYVKENVVAAVPGSIAEFGRVAGASVAGLGKIFSPGGIRDYVDTLRGQGDTQNRFVSPVGAGQLAKEAAANGPADFLYLLAAINIFLGIFNLIPLLPFDGGHVAIATYEAVRSRKGKRYFADITKMLPVTYAVVGLLMLIAVGSFYLDLAKPIGG